MSISMIILAVGIFSLIYGSVNFFVGLRLWQYLGQYLSVGGRPVFWTAFWLIALAYLAARMGRPFLPSAARSVLTMGGAYWLAAMFYFLLFFFLLDLAGFFGRLLHILPAGWKGIWEGGPLAGVVVFVLVAAIIIYGTWNARTPYISRYELLIPKEAGGMEQLRIVMVSDIHLGEIIHNGRLTRMVDAINGLQPDLVLLPGDVVDEDIGSFVEQDMASSFRRLAPRYGIYAVPGNHEYIGGHINEAVYYLEKAGIRVLQDEFIKINDAFYIVGRDDKSQARINRDDRGKSLSEIMQDINPRLPVILLDHQPDRLGEAQQTGVDLQLSGHTHRGQLFPLRFITGAIFEKDWGYLQKDGLQVIVSSGFGTWGPPIRTGSRSEIVEIILRFEGQKSRTPDIN